MKFSRRSALLGLLAAPFVRWLPKVEPAVVWDTSVEPTGLLLEDGLDQVYVRHAYSGFGPGYKDDGLPRYDGRPLLKLLREKHGS